MFKFILIAMALVAAQILAEIDHEIKLSPGKVSELKNPEYPDAYASDKPVVWKFESEPDTNIQIMCEDFKIWKPDDCKAIQIEVDSGDAKQSYCGHYDAFKEIFSTNTLIVKLKGDGKAQAMFSCFVKSTQAPSAEEVEVKLNKIYKFGSPNEPVPFFDKVWHLTAEKDYQVDLVCYVNLLKITPCHVEVLTINVGSGPHEYCSIDKVFLFSEGKNATIRLELDKVGNGKVVCVAQAATKDLEAGFERSAAKIFDEDSSEYGGPAGKKQTTCRCGWANKPNARILYGEETAPNEYPWVVAIRSYFSNTYAKCGGAIVTHRHVITAAHCLVDLYGDLQPFDPQNVHVMAGVHNLFLYTPKETYHEYIAERIFVRPEFPKYETHDFAVIVVKESIQFSEFVGPICLSPKNIAKPGEVVTIMGWGETDVKYSSNVLMEAKTTVTDSNKCTTKPWEICTKTKPSATCSGDSGGPIVWLDPDTNRYTQVSLVSRGHPDCVSTPTVSTNVAYFYDYLQQIINDTYPDEQTCIKV